MLKTGFLVDEASERRISDAAQALLNTCLEVSPPLHDSDMPPEVRALAMAVQAVSIADFIEPGVAAEKRGVLMSPGQVIGLSFGLGLGAGSTLGSFSVEKKTIDLAIEAFFRGFQPGFNARADILAEINRMRGGS